MSVLRTAYTLLPYAAHDFHAGNCHAFHSCGYRDRLSLHAFSGEHNFSSVPVARRYLCRHRCVPAWFISSWIVEAKFYWVAGQVGFSGDGVDMIKYLDPFRQPSARCVGFVILCMTVWSFRPAGYVGLMKKLGSPVNGELGGVSPPQFLIFRGKHIQMSPV